MLAFADDAQRPTRVDAINALAERAKLLSCCRFSLRDGDWTSADMLNSLMPHRDPATGRAPMRASAYLVGSPARAGCFVARLAPQVLLNNKACQSPTLLVAAVPLNMAEYSPPPIEKLLSNAPNADVRKLSAVPFQRRRTPFWNQVPCQPLTVVENQVPSGWKQIFCVAPGISPGSKENRTSHSPTGEAARAAFVPTSKVARVKASLWWIFMAYLVGIGRDRPTLIGGGLRASSLPRLTRPSAGSGELLFERLDERAAVMVAQPALKLGGGELTVRLDHGPLAVHPLGLDRVQPRALAWQAADQEAAAAGALDPAVVGPDPGPHLPADVPGGVVPDQRQHPDAVGRELAGHTGEEGAGDGTDRPSLDEPQQHPLRPRQPEAVTGERFRLGVVAAGRVQAQAERLARRPGVQGRLRQSREPDLVREPEGPARPAPRQADQPVAATFFCA